MFLLLSGCSNDGDGDDDTFSGGGGNGFGGDFHGGGSGRAEVQKCATVQPKVV